MPEQSRRIMIGETKNSFSIAFQPPLHPKAVGMLRTEVPFSEPRLHEDGSQEFSFMRAYFGMTEHKPGHHENRSVAFQAFAAKIARQILNPEFDGTLYTRETNEVSLFAEHGAANEVAARS